MQMYLSWTCKSSCWVGSAQTACTSVLMAPERGTYGTSKPDCLRKMFGTNAGPPPPPPPAMSFSLFF